VVAFFFYTHDCRYIIKTITLQEHRTMLKMLPEYHQHIQNNTDTLLTRLYGAYKINWDTKELLFFVMSNVYDTDKVIHQRYDLKGSTVGRTVGEEMLHKPGVVLKDLDFVTNNQKLAVGPLYVEGIKQQIKQDVEFLAKHDIIDYSLLIGIHSPGRDIEQERERWIQVNQPQLDRIFKKLQQNSSAEGSYLDLLDFNKFTKHAYDTSTNAKNERESPDRLMGRSFFSKRFWRHEKSL